MATAPSAVTLRTCLARLESAMPDSSLPGFVPAPVVIPGAWASTTTGAAAGGAPGGATPGRATPGRSTPEGPSRAQTPGVGEEAAAAAAGTEEAGEFDVPRWRSHLCCMELVERFGASPALLDTFVAYVARLEAGCG